ncbi:flagellar biosynthetic protein FliR [Halioxenophilus sp. WMMB6]|uniref:flagellar biosynthetic protein FliR n=1 Tax=Halioxenophilus sp. WMMB6 TaxID=3073815 RepID=UPI00295F329B|nr:flagellar biosynthetic protein FliR [Halioxenophilus sp. WMMB6]
MLGQYLWPLIRISAFIVAVPIFGAQVMPARIRLVLAIPLTILVAPLLPTMPDVEMLSLPGMIITVQQFIFGAALGFIFQLLMQLFVVGGQAIAMNMGLGFASMNDPANGVTVTVLSQFYLTMAILLFLSMNGHLILIELIVRSFYAWPVGGAIFSGEQWLEFARLGSWVFAGALVMALPIITALLVVNLAFGVMSRSAPQMNVFAVGFPITLVFGMVIIWFGLVNFLPQFELRSNQLFEFVESFIGL